MLICNLFHIVIVDTKRGDLKNMLLLKYFLVNTELFWIFRSECSVSVVWFHTNFQLSVFLQITSISTVSWRERNNYENQLCTTFNIFVWVLLCNPPKLFLEHPLLKTWKSETFPILFNVITKLTVRSVALKYGKWLETLILEHFCSNYYFVLTER